MDFGTDAGMIYVNVREAGHMAVAATFFRLKAHCWKSMVFDVKDFVQHCLHCVGSRVEELDRRPHGDAVHGSGPDHVTHYDSLRFEDSRPVD